MSFWMGIGKGLQNVNERRHDTREREGQQAFTAERDEQQREFEREQGRLQLENQLRINRENNLWTAYKTRDSSGRGTRSGSSGGTSTRGVTFLTNFLAADENIDEESLTGFLSQISEHPETANDIMESILTRNTEQGYDTSPSQIFSDLKAWIPVLVANPDDVELKAEMMKLLSGDVDVLDDETYGGLMGQVMSPDQEMQAEPAFYLRQPLNAETAEAQYEQFRRKVIVMASKIADGNLPEGLPRETYELLLQAQDSDKVASTQAIADLERMFGAQAVEALKATGNPLFNTIDQNWNINAIIENAEPDVAEPVVPEAERVVPDSESTESERPIEERAKPMRSFTSVENLHGALRNRQIQPGQPILFNGVERPAPTLAEVEAALEEMKSRGN